MKGQLFYSFAVILKGFSTHLPVVTRNIPFPPGLILLSSRRDAQTKWTPGNFVESWCSKPTGLRQLSSSEHQFDTCSSYISVCICRYSARVPKKRLPSLSVPSQRKKMYHLPRDDEQMSLLEVVSSWGQVRRRLVGH